MVRLNFVQLLSDVKYLDIQFWKERRSLEGLSVRSVFFNVFQSLIVLLYVWDNDTNIMIRITVFIGLFIELWKIMKVVNIERVEGRTILGFIPLVKITDKGSYVESSTRQYDNVSNSCFQIYFISLLVCYSLHSNTCPGPYSHF